MNQKPMKNHINIKMALNSIRKLEDVCHLPFRKCRANELKIMVVSLYKYNMSENRNLNRILL